MLNFTPIKLDQKDAYTPYLRCGSHRGCAYSFVNLYLWGRQQAAIVENQLVVFSQFDRKSVYTFPSGCCDATAALEAIIHDAKERGIPCRLVGLSQDDCAALERLYPGKLKYHYDRDSFDYVYDINDLADLPGRKFQKKRNHLNRFRQQNPDHRLEPITEENLPEVEALVEKWYALREEADPHSDFLLERAALKKALRQLVQNCANEIVDPAGQTITIMQAACMDDAHSVKLMLEEAIPGVKTRIVMVGPTICTHAGPGTLALVYLGKDRDRT